MHRSYLRESPAPPPRGFDRASILYRDVKRLASFHASQSERNRNCIVRCDTRHGDVELIEADVGWSQTVVGQRCGRGSEEGLQWHCQLVQTGHDSAGADAAGHRAESDAVDSNGLTDMRGAGRNT